MIETLHIMFSYSFILRALIVGVLVSLCASLLGVSLVLKRYSMIGDGLSHVGFGAIAVATAFNWAPMEFTIPVVIIAAFLLLRLSENSSIKGDSAIAIISTGALAFGILVASMTTGMNTDINSYLFGSILEVINMIETLHIMFSYSFILRALIVGVLVSLCASLLGVSLVLKRYSMIGDGLSHVGFGAIAVATAFNWAPMEFTIPVVIIAAFLLLRLSENSSIKGDSAIAIISTGALAFGILVASMTTGMNTDINSYLFGSILAMTLNDVLLSVVLSAVVIVLFVLFYNKIFAVTFDETFSNATGIRANVYNMLIAILTAITIVLGMRMMGALLISSLIIFPALTSMRVCKHFKTVVIVSAVISIICFLLGLIISYFFSTPTGATVVVINIGIFILFSILGKLRLN